MKKERVDREEPASFSFSFVLPETLTPTFRVSQRIGPFCDRPTARSCALETQHSVEDGTTKLRAVQHSTIPCSSAQRSLPQYSAAHFTAAQHSAAQHSAAQRSAAQHKAAQLTKHSTAQCSTAQRSSAHRSSAQRSSAQDNAAQLLPAKRGGSHGSVVPSLHLPPSRTLFVLSVFSFVC